MSRRPPPPRKPNGALLAKLPRALRPKLTAAQRRELGLYHVSNLDAIATGQAEPPMLWDYIGSVLTWVRVAQLLDAGVAEMAVQLDVVTRLIERFGRTNRVAFDGPDYQLAKQGVAHMDDLADIVDLVTAEQAAVWSEIQTQAMADAVEKEKAAA